MAAIKLRLKVDHTVTVEKENYRDEYDASLGDDGEEGGEIPDDFVAEAYQEALADGSLDLGEVLESASVDVDIVA